MVKDSLSAAGNDRGYTLTHNINVAVFLMGILSSSKFISVFVNKIVNLNLTAK